MLTVIVLLLFACMIAFDFVPQVKQPDTRKKDVAVYIAFVIVSFSVLLLYSLYVKIPSPAEPIKDVIKTLFNIK